MKIVVVGAGYVGLATACLLSQHHDVRVVDMVKEKVDKINMGISPFSDSEIEEYLQSHPGRVAATLDASSVYKEADYVIVATPTNYKPEIDYFDTSAVESVIKEVLSVKNDVCIVIKSTIPVGYTNQLRKRFPHARILFSPEFLREGNALKDNLYPSRIVVGATGGNELQEEADAFAKLLFEGAHKSDVPILIMSATEAEAVKLFANTYLALRVSFFNELDAYAEMQGLSSRKIIEGIGYDPRIGNYYNNPSFGYGGYCLPKDTRQLLANYKRNNVPNSIITAIVAANSIRKKFIAGRIMNKADGSYRKKIGCAVGDNRKKVIGIYRLVMKSGSDNFRESSIQGVMRTLDTLGGEILIYEPAISEDTFSGYRVVKNWDEFKQMSDVIVANRYSPELEEIADKLYTRDIYFRD